MRRATNITLQLHQILRLPRYNARSNRHHLPTSPNIAPATQNDHPTSERNLLKTGETSFPMRDRSEQSEHEPRPFRPRKRKPQPAASRSDYHSKFHHMLRLPRKVTHKFHQMLRLPRKVTHEFHQMLHLPRKIKLMIDPHHICNVIYTARSNRHQPPTLPNAAPATQNDHPRSDRNWLQTGETSFRMPDGSEHDPSMIWEWSETVPTQKTQTATRRAAKATFRTRQEQILLKITTFPAPAIIPNFTTSCACHKKNTWTLPNAAPPTKSDTWTSPNAVPPTKSHT